MRALFCVRVCVCVVFTLYVYAALCDCVAATIIPISLIYCYYYVLEMFNCVEDVHIGSLLSE